MKTYKQYHLYRFDRYVTTYKTREEAEGHISFQARRFNNDEGWRIDEEERHSKITERSAANLISLAIDTLTHLSNGDDKAIDKMKAHIEANDDLYGIPSSELIEHICSVVKR